MNYCLLENWNELLGCFSINIGHRKAHGNWKLVVPTINRLNVHFRRRGLCEPKNNADGAEWGDDEPI